MVTRKRLGEICNAAVFHDRELANDEKEIYFRFCEFVEADLYKQLKETGDYVAPDDFYVAFTTSMEV